MSEACVRLADAHTLGYCNRGMRAWFAREGLDFNQFRQAGLPIEALEATGDAMALKLCQFVRDEVEHGRR